MKKTIANINKTKSWFSENIKKIDKPLTRCIKKKGIEFKSIKLEMKWRNYNWQCRNTKDHKRLHKQHYANRMDNMEEMEKFLEKYNLPKMNKEELEDMNIPITSNEIETVIKIFQ